MNTLCFIAVGLIIVTGQFPSARAAGPYHSLGDIFQHQLAGLEKNSPGTNPYTGGRNTLHCCLLAVNESLDIQDGNLIFQPGQTCLKGDPDTFLQYQFPCTAAYNGSEGDQPQVWVSYSWCANNCPGWSRTRSTPSTIRNWVQPFISFIAPAIIFCLSVARRRRITVPSRLFPRSFSEFRNILALAIKIPTASALVTLDILVWLITVLSVAGPCLVSGIYEAVLDLRLISFLERRTHGNSLTVRQRAHLLYVILLGNFDQDPTWNHLLEILIGLPNDSLRQRVGSALSNGKYPRSKNQFELDFVSLSPVSPPSSLRRQDSLFKTPSTPGSHRLFQASYESDVRVKIVLAKTRLKTLLEAQIGFGAAVGAAVVFFTSSFIYCLIDLRSTLGASTSAHNMAFGLFWMIVPHIAVVSSLLLSGTNPNTWEAIVSSGEMRADSRIKSESTYIPPAHPAAEDTSENGSFTFGTPGYFSAQLKCARTLIFRPVYESPYRPAWPWHWGSSKAIWIAQLVNEYPNLTALNEEVLRMSPLQWLFSVSFPALFLLIVPSFLGGMVSYTTPSVGLSCRSMTMLLYAASQTLLIILWLCDWIFWKRDSAGRIKVDSGSGYNRSQANFFWYMVFALGIATAFFFSILGSTFQLLGLYSNCLCYLPIQYWRVRNSSPEAQMFLGSGSRLQIYYARAYWLPTGISATVFLIATTYFGWWYQRHLRIRFKILIGYIDGVNSDDIWENLDGDASPGTRTIAPSNDTASGA